MAFWRVQDENYSFEFNNKNGYIEGAYHTGFGEREDFVTLTGIPTIVDHGDHLAVTWTRVFREVETPMLFNFIYRSLVVEDDSDDGEDLDIVEPVVDDHEDLDD